MQVSFTNWCFIINICIIPYAFPALLITYQNIIQNPFSMLIETYFDLKVPWNFLQSSMELFEQHPWFHGIPWNLINFIFKKIIFLNIVFGIWLMIRCYLAKISQKRNILHWFQYRNSYFEHPSVSENGARSAKMACCLRLKLLITPKLKQFNTRYQTAFCRVVWTHFAKVAETFGRMFWKRQRQFSKCLFKEVKVFKMQLIWGFKTS